jgi:hypothetical protein
MSRTLISSENSKLQNAYGCAVAAIVLPFALTGAAIAGVFGRPVERTAEEVARYIRAMLDGTVMEPDSGYDYDEFSSVQIADGQLNSIVRRACQAFEAQPDSDRAALESLLAEAESLTRVS